MSQRSSKGSVEYRSIPLGNTQAEDGKLSGVAIRFNSATQIGDPEWGFREEFAPGSFTKTLQERDVVLLDNHDSAKPIARKSAGTLRTDQTDNELRWDADPVDTSYARDAAANIKAGNYGGCSVGFRAVKEDWLDDDGNPSDATSGTRRVVREAELPEFSVVTFPAYGDTEVSARDMVSAAREARAAKASYADVDTCGECGVTGQYGQYCGSCGEAMTQPSQSSNSFCPSCGSDISGDRDGHVCTENADVSLGDDSADVSVENRDVPKPDSSTSEMEIARMINRLTVHKECM
jgi:uncharacterized protein